MVLEETVRIFVINIIIFYHEIVANHRFETQIVKVPIIDPNLTLISMPLLVNITNHRRGCIDNSINTKMYRYTIIYTCAH